MYRNLKAEMLRRGLTQNDLGKALCLCVGAVSMRLHGRTEWKFSEAVAVKEWLGVDMSLEELFKWTEG